jgi:diguanylate cyclase (GGDEF)-like protein
LPSLRFIPAFCATLLLGVGGTAQPPQKTVRPLRTITTAREAHDIPLEVAARGYPVRLRGVVTFYDPYMDVRHAALLIHDSTASIFVPIPTRPILPIKPGTLVEVTGTTGNGDYAPVILHGQVTPLGTGPLPEHAPRPTMAELLSGSQDGQWIEIEGVVRAVRIQSMDVDIEVDTVGGPISAIALHEVGADYDSLIDATVRIRGNEVPVFNGDRQMVGARLLFPSLQEIKVVRPAPPDPYALPPIPVNRILRFTPGVVLRHRAHVRGAVTLSWVGRMLCIQESDSGLCMTSPSAAPVRTGQMVDVVGFPAISDFKPTLEDASFRSEQEYGSTNAAPVTIQQALRGDHDHELIQIEGQLLGQDRASGDLTLMLRSGKSLFAAILPADAGGSTASWPEGSLVRVTGVCSVRMDPKTTVEGAGSVQPESITVLLRSIRDVSILHAPSWWTASHALVVLSIVGVFAFAAFAWIFVLRRRVEQQTLAIRQSEERLRHLSQHDALTGLPNRFLLNDRLGMALKRAGRFDTTLGLLMVDLDGFKEVNDTFGHHVGDLVLREVAVRLVRAVRQTDTVARLGGDEFIVLLPDLHRESEAEAIAAKLVTSISEPIELENGGNSGHPGVHISGSIGVCTTSDENGDPEKLLQRVDAAMYKAKAAGKNQYLACSYPGEPADLSA